MITGTLCRSLIHVEVHACGIVCLSQLWFHSFHSFQLLNWLACDVYKSAHYASNQRLVKIMRYIMSAMWLFRNSFIGLWALCNLIMKEESHLFGCVVAFVLKKCLWRKSWMVLEIPIMMIVDKCIENHDAVCFHVFYNQCYNLQPVALVVENFNLRFFQ